MATIFTKIINGEIPCYKVAENDKFIAFLDINPLKKGHTLVVPKEEKDYIFRNSDEVLSEILLFAKKVADIHGLQLSIGNVNKGVRTVLSIDKYQTKYKRILLAKKLGVIPVFTSILLYMLSIYMDAHFDMQIVRTIRHFSFNVLLITILGIIYLYLFTRNLKVNYEYCRIDPTSFNTNVKYASFGIALIALMFLVSIVWIITLLVRIL